MSEKRGSLKRKSLIISLIILVSLFFVIGIKNNVLGFIYNESNETQENNLTDYNIITEQNTSENTIEQQNTTSETIIDNKTESQLSQINTSSDIPTFITSKNINSNSRIVNERLEIYSLGNGYNNAILYSRDRFKNYNNKFYALNGLADISSNKGIINITYGINNYLELKPYFIYNNNKISYSELENNVKSGLNINYYIRKNRDYFEFGNNFTNVNGITAFGFDYNSNIPIKSYRNIIYIGDSLILDYNDLARNDYDLDVNDNSIRISNLKTGFNDLDPYIYLNSSSSIDGYVLGDGSTGFSAVTNSLNAPTGYDSNGNIYRVFYSFPTYYLGPNVNITKASLRIVENQAVDATDGGAGPCNLYITWESYLYDGTFIGNSLDTNDYNSGSYYTSITLGAPNYYQIPLNVSRINQSGNTDFKISPNWQQEQGCNEYNNLSMSESPSGQPLLNITYAYIVNFSMSYDANGNLIYGFGKYYEYDDFNRLIRVRQININGSIIAQYWYDADGNRIKKLLVADSGNQTIYYIGNFVQVRNSSGVFNTTYYYDRDSLVAERRYDNNLYFYHPDHLGSTSLITNQTGDVVDKTSYDPYGLVVEGGSSRYLYTGKEKDFETNFEYYGARYYNPYVTRFTQPDQLILDIYNPQDLNRYSYVRNNPYKYVDPTGLWAVTLGPIGDIGFGFGVIQAVGFAFSYDKQVGAQFGVYETHGAGVITNDQLSLSLAGSLYPSAKSISEISGKSNQLSLNVGEYGSANIGESYSKFPQNSQEASKPLAYNVGVGVAGRTLPFTAGEYLTQTNTLTLLQKTQKDNNINNNLNSQVQTNIPHQNTQGNSNSNWYSQGIYNIWNFIFGANNDNSKNKKQ